MGDVAQLRSGFWCKTTVFPENARADSSKARAALRHEPQPNIERNDNNAKNSADPTLSTVYKLAQALYIPPALLLPGGSMLVGGVCEIDELPFELRWPNHATDTCPFTPEYIREATGEMPPQFTTVDNDVPQEL